MRAFILSILMLVSSVTFAGVSDPHFNLGVEHHKNGDYLLALDHYEMAADMGSATAYYNIGYMYYAGQGVVRDKEIARYYLEKAVNNGVDLSRINPLWGAEEYLLWARKQHYYKHHNTNQQIATAHFNRGVEYHKHRQYRKAFSYYRRAADRGEPMAYYNLGYMYYAGHGVQQDYHLARMYVTHALHAGLNLNHVNPLYGAEQYLAWARSLL